MPAKYHIHTRPAPPRHKPIGKYGIVDWREDCSACHNCVKRECAYSVYDQERDRLAGAVEYVDYLYECKGCLCCVQSCTKGLLTWDMNPEYLRLGDEAWTPDIISGTWFQAETGRIPVSGAGYPGPFRGPGFDSILTDMSEIVRPTRDGIHGREYISTSVDIGRKPTRLEFNPDGSLAAACPPLVETPIPILFDAQPWHWVEPRVAQAILDAAGELGTFGVTDDPALADHPAAAPRMWEGEAPAEPFAFNETRLGRTLALPEATRLAEWDDSPDVMEKIKKAWSANPDLVAIVRLPLGSRNINRALELTNMGVDCLHVFADWHGDVASDRVAAEAYRCSPIMRAGQQHVSMAVRELHQALVKAGIRDEVTVIASGGISMAEHVVKSLLCGADLVAIDIPLMIALECRVCQNCRRELKCPIDLNRVDHDYAVRRIVNLMGAWHDQMLEMMGAMGIREARRLRGEAGRAMFFDDLERECFAPIFGAKGA